jgi:hypothetical protein
VNPHTRNSCYERDLIFNQSGERLPGRSTLALLPPADEFVGLLAKAVAYIPDIGQDLSKLISEAAGLDYMPVGAELFIESAANHYQINTNELALEQVFDFRNNFLLL